MPKSQILTNKKDISELFKAGRYKVGFGLRITYRNSGSSQESKILFAVSRKAGNAVYRNRCKRILREAWRLKSTQVPQGYHFALSPARGFNPVQIQTANLDKLIGPLFK